MSTINALSTFALFEAQALRLTTNALTTGQQWPFFSMPMFEVEADLLYRQSKAGETIAIHPLVRADQRLEWEQYANANQGWILDAYRFYDVEGTPPPICPAIHPSRNCTPVSYSSNRSLYAPVWQLAPAPGQNEHLINVDGLSLESFATSFKKLIEKRRVIIGDALDQDTNTGDLLSFLMTPIFQNITTDSPIVALLVGLIPWNDYFRNLVPEGIGGIEVVVSNSFDEFSIRDPGLERGDGSF